MSEAKSTKIEGGPVPGLEATGTGTATEVLTPSILSDIEWASREMRRAVVSSCVDHLVAIRRDADREEWNGISTSIQALLDYWEMV